MSYIDKTGNLILVNDFEVHNGHYQLQCQVNESGTTRIESSYILTVKQPTENLDGKIIQLNNGLFCSLMYVCISCLHT